MNACDLTSRRVALDGGGSATPYPWNGEEVLVRDDALTVLRCIALLQDERATPEEKSGEFVPLFFADPGDAFTACDYDPADLGRLIDVNVNPSFTDSTNAIAPIAPTHPRRFRRRQAPFPASRSGARSFVR